MEEVYRVREEGKVVVIDLLSELDRFSVLAIKNEIRALLKRGRNRIVVNFKNLERINSTIVGALVTMQHLAKERGGDLRLCCLNERIKRTFDLIGASKLLKIYDEEGEAIASYG